jgi:hypothetical protein
MNTKETASNEMTKEIQQLLDKRTPTIGERLMLEYRNLYGDAEQFQPEPTIRPTGRRNPNTGKPIVRLSRIVAGKPRLRDPETNRPLHTSGDVACFKTEAGRIFGMYWKGQWMPIPASAEFDQWSLDSVIENPDGDSVEPDAPDSWFTLLNLI